ncbi:hypothetical protein P1J78_22465 [Psychromarinibacter sp. C21-152]|uniref:Uncharacterized protein n=1 Tax=Psychromarinibacter sediminicola TaxID=3033385 RepID=A0AAE3NWH8_9RHOB|nr:hypothetical protein [Psychromarinibacter sediminicola]MDF0603499.1 hypothetical protein [Psychromarinibacter sediminicola]
MKSRDKDVMGVHAPPPRPTLWAALILANALTILFLLGIGLFNLVF